MSYRLARPGAPGRGTARDQVGEAAGHLSDTASDLAGRAGATLREAAETARRGAGQAGETVSDAAAWAGQYVGTAVQAQPLLSLVGAAAIGYALGFLIHRR